MFDVRDACWFAKHSLVKICEEISKCDRDSSVESIKWTTMRASRPSSLQFLRETNSQTSSRGWVLGGSLQLKHSVLHLARHWQTLEPTVGQEGFFEGTRSFVSRWHALGVVGRRPGTFKTQGKSDTVARKILNGEFDRFKVISFGFDPEDNWKCKRWNISTFQAIIN